jgi:hypothetical protein
VSHSGLYAYVGNAASGTIAVFSLNPSSGELTPLAGSPYTAAVGAGTIGFTWTGAVAYSPACNANTIFGYSVDRSTGELSPLASSLFPTGDCPTVVSVDPNHVYIANSYANTISVYRLNRTTGSLTPTPGTPFSTGAYPAANDQPTLALANHVREFSHASRSRDCANAKGAWHNPEESVNRTRTRVGSEALRVGCARPVDSSLRVGLSALYLVAQLPSACHPPYVVRNDVAEESVDACRDIEARRDIGRAPGTSHARGRASGPRTLTGLRSRPIGPQTGSWPWDDRGSR